MILQQDAIAGTVWQRDGARWTERAIAGDVALEFPALGCSVSLLALYEGVTLAGAAG